MVKRFLLALAVAAGVNLFVPATPAAAGGQEIRICFEVGAVGGRPVFDCFTIVVPDLAPQPPWPPTCLSCPATIILWNDLDLKLRYDFVKDLGQGLKLLGLAEVSTKPEEVKQLLAQATGAFKASAERLRGARAQLKDVGWADLKNGKFHSDPTGNIALKSAGENIVAGLDLMQLALNDPEPQPNIEAAMERFGRSYRDIADVYGG